MIPVVALIGRPNVGKSTLFNQLTRTRDALVIDLPGTTRDRKFGEGEVGPLPYVVIDTGGVGLEENQVDELMAQQSLQAIEQADVLLMLVDGQSGVTASDEQIANLVRQSNKPVILVVNKTDGVQVDVATADFYQLGLGEPVPIVAKAGKGIVKLAEQFSEHFPEQVVEESDDPIDKRIRIALVGRPNVGKSTLVNRMLGEDRVVVCDFPGTTRDSIDIPLDREGERYTIIDTAGVRKKRKVKETVEKFSVIQTLKAIESCHVAVLLIDAQGEVGDQDLQLLDFILQAGKACVIAINKWDGLAPEQRQDIKKSLKIELNFVNYVEQLFISALHGTNVGHIFDAVKRAYESAHKEIPTPALTKVLEQTIATHMPPLIKGRRIKLRYAHLGRLQPPTIVIHGNQTESLPVSYQRYLINAFRKAFQLVGTPIKLQLKTGDNPYKDKRNKLTPRQMRKRKRLKKFVQKKSK